jgi:outer membrane protein TolC
MLPSPSVSLPSYTVGGLGTAFNSMFNFRYPQYTLGVSVGFPLRNRAAEAQYQIALEQRKQIGTQEVALIQRIQYEARNALQAYRSARARLLAATAARTAAEAVSASELRRFRAGESTTFLVLQRQITVANDRGRELQAQTDLQKALVQLDLVTGAILDKNNVNVETLGGAATPFVPGFASSSNTSGAGKPNAQNAQGQPAPSASAPPPPQSAPNMPSGGSPGSH